MQESSVAWSQAAPFQEWGAKTKSHNWRQPKQVQYSEFLVRLNLWKHGQFHQQRSASPETANNHFRSMGGCISQILTEVKFTSAMKQHRYYGVSLDQSPTTSKSCFISNQETFICTLNCNFYNQLNSCRNNIRYGKPTALGWSFSSLSRGPGSQQTF